MGRNSLIRYINVFFILGWSIIALTAQVKEIPRPFNPPRLVNDYVNLLSQSEFQSLEQKLVAYDDSTSTQIAVVIERSLEGEDIFTYSQRLAEEWRIGQEGTDNGVLLLVTTEDRQLRIHTGYGAEVFLTDAMSKRIISNVLVPNFRNGDYFEGIDRATDVIMQLGSGEYQNNDQDGEIPFAVIVFLVIIIIIVIIIIVSNVDGGDDGGYWREGRYDDYGRRRSRGGWIITPGSGGFGGGGFGGGGFGGFGGGSFGGGGASGSW
jgi:uncharacterized protein